MVYFQTPVASKQTNYCDWTSGVSEIKSLCEITHLCVQKCGE